MTSKAARRRRRKSHGISIPGGTAPQPVTRGRKPVEDARAVAMAARTRVFAWHRSLGPAPDPHEPLSGTQGGLCLLSEGEGGKALVAVWEALSASRRAYSIRVIGATGNPQCAAAPMLADVLEVDPSLRVDLRDPVERDRAAKALWLSWEDRIARLPAPQMKWAIRAALGDSINPEAARLWGLDGLPTPMGRAFILALRHLQDATY